MLKWLLLLLFVNMCSPKTQTLPAPVIERPKIQDKIPDTDHFLQFSSLAHYGNFCIDTNDDYWDYWTVDGIQPIPWNYNLSNFIYYPADLIFDYKLIQMVGVWSIELSSKVFDIKEHTYNNMSVW